MSGPGGQPPDVEIPPPDHWPDLADVDPGTFTPTGVDLERGLLGVAIASPQTLPELAAQGVTAATFTEPAHAVLWNVVRTLDATGQPVSAVSIQIDLERRGSTKDRSMRTLAMPVGLYVLKLIESAPFPAQASWYAEQALSAERRRADAALGIRIQQIAESPQDDAHDTVMALITEHAADDQAFTKPRPSSWQPLDLTGVDTDELERATLLARSDGIHLLYPGKVHSAVGEPSSGKSWLGLVGAAQILNADGAVTMLDFEDRPGPVVRRLIDMGVPKAKVLANFRYVRPDEALTATQATHLDRAVGGSDLVLLDGVTEAMTMHGLSLSDNEDVAKYLAMLPRRVADLGPAVLQIDHVVKDPDARGRYALGGGHKLAGIDGAQYKVTVTQTFGRGKLGRARITIDKDRHGGIEQHSVGISIGDLVIDSTGPEPDLIGPTRVYIDPPEAGVVGERGEFRPTHIMAQISAYVAVAPGATFRDIKGNVSAKDETLRSAISELVTGGYLRKDPGPGRSHLHYQINPYEGDGWTS